MKLRILAFSAVAAFLFACGGAKTPESVAEAFHKALAAQEYDEASKLATAKGKESIKSLKEMNSQLSSMGGGESEKKKVEVESVKCDVKEKEANCVCKDKDGKETKYKLLQQEDKTWLVDYDKLGGLGEGLNDIEEDESELAPEEDVDDEEIDEEDVEVEVEEEI